MAYILEGIQDDFSIGFDYVHHRCRPVKKYMQSATNVPHIVSNSLDTECKLARVVIPDEAAAYTVQISPFGVIPKCGVPEAWRLILHLSPPLAIV